MITLKSAREIEAMDKAGDFLASINTWLDDITQANVDTCKKIAGLIH